MTHDQISQFVNKHIDDIMSVIEEDDNEGFCVNCGEQVSYVEPDARKYTCPSCDGATVYGAQELLFYV
jgi:Zn finger protein HypA/HybF involved in hydrogenase expression